MIKSWLKFSKFIFLVFAILFLLYQNSNSLALVQSSDHMTTSAPGVLADHVIRFGTTEQIPDGGYFEVVIEGDFIFTSDFDYDDIDLAVATTSGGVYNDRNLSNIVLPLTEMVNIATSSGDSVITFSLMSGLGIGAGEFVEIELGENALFSKTGSSTQITNPSLTGDKDINIRTYDSAGNFIERSEIKVFIIEPVSMSNAISRKRFGASPIGWLGYGTSETIMSLYSNYPAICRYAATTSIPYDSMVDEFSYVDPSVGSNYHTVSISGLVNGGEYEYYVRCRDDLGGSDYYTECVYDVASTSPFQTASGTPILEQDCIDLPVIFKISSIEGASGDDTGTGGADQDGDSTTKTSSGSGGSGGGGGGGVGSETGNDHGVYLPYPPLPGAPGVILKGWGFPMSFVQILQDGDPIGWTNSTISGEFAVFMEELDRGMYTFGVWSNDLESRKSGTYSTTFWIENGTQTTVTDIVIPPTFVITTLNTASLQASGYSTPGASVEIWVYKRIIGPVDESKVDKFYSIVSDDGKWSSNIDLSSKDNGEYYIKARTVIESLSPGEFSQTISFMKTGEVLEEEEGGICAGADLNKDGKVNITDFSILLYYWGTDNACADQNSSGNVDLTDFSIMMYYWTG